MAHKRILSHQKWLIIDSQDNYGTIVFTCHGVRSKIRKDLKLEEFLCLSHMLENDIVFYDTTSKIFASKNEPSIPNDINP